VNRGALSRLATISRVAEGPAGSDPDRARSGARRTGASRRTPQGGSRTRLTRIEAEAPDGYQFESNALPDSPLPPVHGCGSQTENPTRSKTRKYPAHRRPSVHSRRVPSATQQGTAVARSPVGNQGQRTQVRRAGVRCARGVPRGRLNDLGILDGRIGGSAADGVAAATRASYRAVRSRLARASFPKTRNALGEPQGIHSANARGLRLAQVCCGCKSTERNPSPRNGLASASASGGAARTGASEASFRKARNAIGEPQADSLRQGGGGNNLEQPPEHQSARTGASEASFRKARSAIGEPQADSLRQGVGWNDPLKTSPLRTGARAAERPNLLGEALRLPPRSRRHVPHTSEARFRNGHRVRLGVRRRRQHSQRR